MVARSTDGHKTNASLGAEHLDGDGIGDAIVFFRSIVICTIVLTIVFLSDEAKG